MAFSPTPSHPLLANGAEKLASMTPYAYLWGFDYLLFDMVFIAAIVIPLLSSMSTILKLLYFLVTILF